MSAAGRNGSRWRVLGLMMVLTILTVAGLPPVSNALVADVLMTTTIPSGAQCAGVSGTAIAVVPGGKLGLPKIQTLLVTSCVVGSQAKLFFLDPSTEPATLIKTVNTNVTPSSGWESLALRADRVDLIACGVVSGAPKVFSIDFNSISPNTVADGTATLLFTGPAGSTCDGLAWDVISSPKTVYQSGAGGATALHLSEGGAPIAGALPAGCAGDMAGLSIGVGSTAATPSTPAFSGSTLLVACPEVGATPGDDSPDFEDH